MSHSHKHFYEMSHNLKQFSCTDVIVLSAKCLLDKSIFRQINEHLDTITIRHLHLIVNRYLTKKCK